MTPLMMLALTLPPSLAFVIERWMRGREAQARRQSVLTEQLVEELEKIAKYEMRERMQGAEAELKRLAEQVSILTERRYTP